MDLSKYQASALATSIKAQPGDMQSVVAAALGLGSETGSVLDVWKRYLRDQIDLDENKSFLEVELGDLLWYVAVVAKCLGLDLNNIAAKNLNRARDLYPSPAKLKQHIPVLDKTYPKKQRFPRQLVVRFRETQANGRALVSLTLIRAEPNAFPLGATGQGKARLGYTIDESLGDSIDDNSRRVDDYRYHDAIHLGFLAKLGWSPTLRDLLRIKRKKNDETDRVEDGARAVYLEEGLAAVLAQMSLRRGRFKSESTIDSEVLEIVQAVTRDREVKNMPGWLWRQAICAGFTVMHELAKNRGGYVTADLNKRTLTYSRVKPI